MSEILSPIKLLGFERAIKVDTNFSATDANAEICFLDKIDENLQKAMA